MEYFLVLMPVWAFVGITGAIVSLLRGRRRSALIWAAVGFGAILIAVGMYYIDS